MSADSHSGRDRTNSGSDTKRHYPDATHAYQQYKRSGGLPTAPATRNVGESAVRDEPEGQTNGRSVVHNY